MPTRAKYEEAIAAAEADNNPTAAAELRRRLAAEHPPETANAGDKRKAKRQGQREERAAEEAAEGFDMSRYENASVDKLTKAIAKAEADDNADAVTELTLVRGVKRAEADNNAEAAAELRQRLGVTDTTPTAETRSALEQARQQAEEDQATIRKFDTVDPATLEGTPEGAEYRAALGRQQLAQQAEADYLQSIIDGNVMSAADTAKAYGQTMAEAFSLSIVGDEAAAASEIGFDALKGAFGFENENLDTSDYDRIVAERRAGEEQFREENKALTIGQDVVGGIASGGAIYKGLGPLAESGSAYIRALKAAGIGAGEGTVIGFMEGEDTLADRVESAADMAKLGALFGAGTSAAVDVGTAGVRQLQRLRAKGRGKEAPVEKDLWSEEDQGETLFDPRGQRRQRIENERDLGRIERSLDDAEELQAAKEQGADYDVLVDEAEVRLARIYQQAQRRQGKDSTRTQQQLEELDQLVDSDVYDDLYEEFGDALWEAQGRLSAGLREGSKDLDKVLETPMLRDVGEGAKRDQSKKPMKTLGKVADFLTPSIRSAQDRVGSGFAETLNNALNRALRGKHVLSEKTMKPMQRYYDAVDSDENIKRLMLNTNNVNASAAQRADAFRELTEELSKATKRPLADVQKDFADYYQGRAKVAIAPYSRVNQAASLDNKIMHTARHTEDSPTAGAMETVGEKQASRVASNMALRPQTRPMYEKGDSAVNDYLNPFDSDNRWMNERITDTALGEEFGTRAARSAQDQEMLESGDYMIEAIAERMRKLGYGDVAVANGRSIVESATKTALEKMNPLLSTVRSVSFMGTIANFKSALLNVADYASAGAQVGYGNILKTFLQDANIKISAKDQGLAEVVTGDVLRQAKRSGNVKGISQAEKLDRRMQWVLQKSMEISGFEKSTLMAQERIMKAAVIKGRGLLRTAKGEAKFDEMIAESMNKADATLLKDVLRRADNKAGVMKKDPKTGKAVSSLTAREEQVVTMYMLGQLSKAQPINSMQRSLFNLDNPNGRILTLLTTWSIRNADMFRGLIVDNFKKGKIKEGVWGLVGFAAMAMGYGVVNQGRQELFGRTGANVVAATGIPDAMGYQRVEEDDKWRKADVEGMYEDALYTALTVPFGGFVSNNSVGLSKLKQNPVTEIGASVMPPLPILENAYEDLTALGDEEEPVKWKVLERSPVIGPFVTMLRKTFEESI